MTPLGRDPFVSFHDTFDDSGRSRFITNPNIISKVAWPMAKITFLGTSGSVVTRKRMCAGILFQDKLIDVGFGVLTNLLKSGTRLNAINDVYISHTHSDHIGDFTGLVWAMAMENRTKRVRVVSSTSTASTMEKILELQSTPWPFVKFDIDFVRPEDVSVKAVATI